MPEGTLTYAFMYMALKMIFWQQIQWFAEHYIVLLITLYGDL
jgi:hypothetical protein